MHASKPKEIVEQLLAEAKLYRHIAEECGDEELAAIFTLSARECVEDASSLEERSVPAL